jgi:hypothetical protein
MPCTLVMEEDNMLRFPVFESGRNWLEFFAFKRCTKPIEVEIKQAV